MEDVERQVHRPGAGADLGHRGLVRLRAAEAPVERIGERVLLLGGEGGVVEHQGALVAGAPRREVAAREEPARPGDQLLGQGVGRGPGLRHGRRGVRGRRGQLLPGVDHVAARVSGALPLDHLEDVLGEAARDAFLRREATQGRPRIAEGRAVLVVPGHVEGLGVVLEAEGTAALPRDDAEPPRPVELVDPLERRQLEARLAGIGVERQGTRPDDRVIGRLFRRLQVALDPGVLHELDVAEVREALAPHRVGRCVDADLDLDAGEVADRVRVFAARQAAGP